MSFLSSIKQALARLIVRVYPTAWRNQYDVDLFRALEARAVTWAELADLLWCGVEEWSRFDVRRRERPTALAHRAAVALGASLVVAIVATGVSLLVFLTIIAVVRVWIGTNVLEWFGLIRRSGWPFALTLWFSYSLLFSLPAVALCGLSGLGRRWPQIARTLTASSFASFTAWLPIAAVPFLPYVVKVVIAGITGWVLAVVLFPTRHEPHASSADLTALAGAKEADTGSFGATDRLPRILRAVTP